MVLWECPGGLVVRIQRFHQCGPGSIPGLGIEIKPQHTAIPSPPPPKIERKRKKVVLFPV